MVSLGIAILFYLLVPMVGAWRVRRSWGRFRASAQEALQSPELDFSLLQDPGSVGGPAFRLTGTLEAFEGRDRMWIGNPGVSVAVSLQGTAVYFLEDPSDSSGVGGEPPRKAEASSLGAIPEGTQFLVSGSLDTDAHGQVFFASRAERPLLVLAFEGSPGTVLARAVSSGRPKVDHWNSWTPVSLGVGFLLLLVLAYADLRQGGNRWAGLDALTLALLPATFFLPPGIVFFFGFTRFWARGRDSRARSDGLRLGSLTGPHPPRSGLWCETMAHGMLLAGIVTNVVLLRVILGMVLP